MIRHLLRKFIITLARFKFLIKQKNFRKKVVKIAFLTDEFFHPDLMPFGGYGMTLKLITDHINNNHGLLKADIFMCADKDIPYLKVKRYHSADLIFMPKYRGFPLFLQCERLLNQRGTNVFIGVDHHLMYEYYLRNFPYIPWVVWIKAPVDKVILEKIATVVLETKVSGVHNLDEFIRNREEQTESLHRMIEVSRDYGRKIYFATEASHLTEIARRQYRLNDINAFHLPKPIPLPAIEKATFSEKPSFLFLGRLDPIKRPWIYFELAKKIKDADFYVGGVTHYPEVMNPIIAKYNDVPNLKFMGRIDGEDKAALLNRVWAIVNTSIHEGVPVSLLEGFSYGKPAIAALDLDRLTSRFGIYVGEVSGDGDNTNSLERFAAAIERIMNCKFDKEGIGWQANQYIADVHSFAYFESTLVGILNSTSNFEYKTTNLA